MPINMLCPNGHQLVTEDQYAGRKVRCPHCQSIVIVPGAPETAVTAIPVTAVPAPPSRLERNEIDEGDVLTDDDVLGDEDIILEEDVRPRRKRRRDYEDEYEEEGRPRRSKKLKRAMTRQQMKMTNLGLAFHYAMILTILGAMALSGVAFMVAFLGGASAVASGPGGGGAEGAGAMLALASILSWISNIATLIVAPALAVTGTILCCWVPSKTGAKGLIIAAMSIDGAAVLCALLGIILTAGAVLGRVGGAGATGAAMLLLCILCLLAGFVVFMLFLRQLASYVDQPGMADEAMGIIIHFLLLFIGAPIGLIAVTVVFIAVARRDVASGAGASPMGCIFVLFMFAASISLLVFWIKLLFRILNTIGSLRAVLVSRYSL